MKGATIVCGLLILFHGTSAFADELTAKYHLIQGLRQVPESGIKSILPGLRFGDVGLDHSSIRNPIAEEAQAAMAPYMMLNGEFIPWQQLPVEDRSKAAMLMCVILHTPIGQSLFYTEDDFHFYIRIGKAYAEYKSALAQEKQRELHEDARQMVQALNVFPLDDPEQFASDSYFVRSTPKLIHSLMSNRKMLPRVELSESRNLHWSAAMALFVHHGDPSQFHGALLGMHSAYRSGKSHAGLKALEYSVEAAFAFILARANNEFQDRLPAAQRYQMLAEQLHVVMLFVGLMDSDQLSKYKCLNSAFIERIPQDIIATAFRKRIEMIDQYLFHLPRREAEPHEHRVVRADWRGLSSVSDEVLRNLVDTANLFGRSVAAPVAGMPLMANPGDKPTKIRQMVPELVRVRDELSAKSEELERMVGIDPEFEVTHSVYVPMGGYLTASRNLPLATAALAYSGILILDQFWGEQHFYAVVDPATRIEELARAIRASFKELRDIAAYMLQPKHAVGSEAIILGALIAVQLVDYIKFIHPDPEMVSEHGPSVGILEGHLYYPGTLFEKRPYQTLH